MTKWINRKDKEPDPKLVTILVFAKCGTQHVAFYDYEAWVHTECCHRDIDNDQYTGSHTVGDDIDFDYWMRLPKPPKE